MSENGEGAESTPDSEETPFGPAYSNYVLAVLFIAYVFNFIDRTIPSMLVEPIKEDLGVSDTQMGLLTGTMPLSRIAAREVSS